MEPNKEKDETLNAGDTSEANPKEPVVVKTPGSSKKETFSKDEVRELIAQAVKEIKEANAPKVAKKSTTHLAKMYRFDNKWVIDFKDRNIDPYSKSIIHAFNKFNEQKREEEAWVELVFEDKSTKEVPLIAYISNRVAVECEIIKKETKDMSYSVGFVERKKVDGYKTIGTGVKVDQMVQMSENFYTVRHTDGLEFELPEYILA